MQDKYVGDVGDFGKYGLLRTLAGIEPEATPRYRLGVVWYLLEDAGLLYDAKLEYLSKPDELRRYDEELFDVLRDIVDNKKRTVKEVKNREILGREGRDAVYFAEPVPNRRKRCQWQSRALDKLRDAKVVFFDPDKGLATPEREAKPGRSLKHAYVNEVRPFVNRGQTVVIYQSYWRDGTHDEEMRKWRDERLTDFDLDEHPRVVGTIDRAFIVLPATPHVEHIDRRLRSFVERWGEHFKHQALDPDR